MTLTVGKEFWELERFPFKIQPRYPDSGLEATIISSPVTALNH